MCLSNTPAEENSSQAQQAKQKLIPILALKLTREELIGWILEHPLSRGQTSSWSEGGWESGAAEL